MRSQHPVLQALYAERMVYMQQETLLLDQIDQQQEKISKLLKEGQEPKEEKMLFKQLIRSLSHYWDALIETNKQIREFADNRMDRLERCPICNALNCSLCIPF